MFGVAMSKVPPRQQHMKEVFGSGCSSFDQRDKASDNTAPDLAPGGKFGVSGMFAGGASGKKPKKEHVLQNNIATRRKLRGTPGRCVVVVERNWRPAFSHLFPTSVDTAHAENFRRVFVRRKSIQVHTRARIPAAVNPLSKSLLTRQCVDHRTSTTPCRRLPRRRASSWATTARTTPSTQ